MEMKNIVDWASPEIKVAELTHGWSGVTYRLNLRRFVPKPGDILRKTWMDGPVKKSHDIPAYGIVDMQEAAVELARYCSWAMFPAVKEFVRPLDELFKQTYRKAILWCKAAPVNAIFSQVYSRLCC
jgi:hypothetical protein